MGTVRVCRQPRKNQERVTKGCSHGTSVTKHEGRTIHKSPFPDWAKKKEKHAIDQAKVAALTVLTCQEKTSHNITGSFPVYSHDNKDIGSYTNDECVTVTRSCMTNGQKDILAPTQSWPTPEYRDQRVLRRTVELQQKNTKRDWKPATNNNNG